MNNISSHQLTCWISGLLIGWKLYCLEISAMTLNWCFCHLLSLRLCWLLELVFVCWGLEVVLKPVQRRTWEMLWMSCSISKQYAPALSVTPIANHSTQLHLVLVGQLLTPLVSGTCTFQSSKQLVCSLNSQYCEEKRDSGPKFHCQSVRHLQEP